MEENNSGFVLTGCMSTSLFSLYIIGVLIVGQVVWAETGVLWDTIKYALCWPITAAVMVAAGG